MTRKTRVDSRLKTLTADRQAAIANYAASHSIRDTVEWARSTGTATSSAAVSLFLSWYRAPGSNDPIIRELLEQMAKARRESANQLRIQSQHFIASQVLKGVNSSKIRRIAYSRTARKDKIAQIIAALFGDEFGEEVHS